jgi:intracellular septation protein
MKQNMSKNFFLISFLPAIAYWYLESNYSLRTALLGGLGLAIVEVIIEKIFTKHIHTLSKFNFFLILFLGTIAIIGNQGIWFKLQPLFTGIAISGFMIFKLAKGKGLLEEMMEMVPSNRKKPPKAIINMLEKHLAAFFIIFGFFMGSLAIWASTARWLFFKTIGFYIAFFIFLLFEMIIIRRKASKQ